MNVRSLSYRKDVNGLRALAVLGVVTFHAFKQILPGGFVGVDVFFVISGYLISRIIIHDLTMNKFSFLDFYSKRLKRILPALLLVLISVWAAAWILFDPEQFLELGRHQLDGAFFILNFRLMGESNYFGLDSNFKPLLHLWSLSIEEQFYIIWPFTVWLIYFINRRYLITFISIILSLSFLFNLYITLNDPTRAFYLPWSRAWELALGALIAHRELFNQDAGIAHLKRPFMNDATFLVAICLVVGSMLFIDEGQLFPGWRALFPVCGAGLVIYSYDSRLKSKILSHRSLQFFGNISYPLYLWHWPLLSFAASRTC